MIHLPLAEFLAMAPQPPAADGQPPQPFWVSLVMPGLLILFMYFLFLRPQMKARKEQDKMISELKSGDEVITQSGIYGTIANVKEKTFVVRIAENVKVEMLKSAVTSVSKREKEKAEAAA
ncbi:MAG: preprotein translocase subunit YajC [Verrucomicrobium sp.]|nr:preprotein translocase subunit YajC [Verrucomicrobium sp.]